MASTWEMYMETPVITRTYMTVSLLTTVACTLDLETPFTFYFNYAMIMQGQLWRLFTTFLFFGEFGVDFVFNMFFLVRYSRMLEEGHFRGRTGEFFFMMLFGAAIMLCIAPFIYMPFMGPSLTFMLVYVWSRLNRSVRMSLLGLFNVDAPFLPWVLIGFTIVFGGSVVVDLIGIMVGHIYYYLAIAYPAISGRRLLATPRFIKVLFEDADVTAPRAPQPRFDGAGAGVVLGEEQNGNADRGNTDGAAGGGDPPAQDQDQGHHPHAD